MARADQSRELSLKVANGIVRLGLTQLRKTAGTDKLVAQTATAPNPILADFPLFYWL
jgi:hypothetical protein